MNPSLPPMNALALLRVVLKRGRNAPEPTRSLSTAYRLDALDARQIRRYKELLGFGGSETPVTYFYVIAQRAHVATLLDDQFPFAIAGMVHVENELVEHAAPALNEALDIVTTVRIEPHAENGARYCSLETVASHGDRTIFTCRSKYLAKRGARKARSARASEENSSPTVGSWALSSSTGREYAKVSGDWNPIHLWTWSARLMGMKEPIIHGMHTVAKACAAIEAKTGQRPVEVSARFKAPIPLGKEVVLAASDDRNAFNVLCDGRIAVQGTLSFASPDSHQSKQEGNI